MGIGGVGDKGDTGTRRITNAQYFGCAQYKCPMPNAQCSMPNTSAALSTSAPCPILISPKSYKN
ncbi:hypothetical protein [Nostoc sp. FACHB-857]|uniref:hypothetical protein n=1 Tax=Nostoc sp. FACHB-857 TaxID=2692840 RepID=UPI0016834091|nr:hypothetical protein [Nostoc sp. FACHB-857]